MKKISLKADDAFKELFAHEAVRKQFLSDVLLILNDDTRIGIEMQVHTQKHGKAEYIPQLLEHLGEVPPELKNKIESDQNYEILDRWHLSAARADSIRQFREKENI